METDSYRILLDLPSSRPALDFDDVAKHLAEIIEQSEPCFAVGIFGRWGSGKTTFMEAIERNLSTEGAIPVRFSAWRYEKEEHLIVPLLDTVREALVGWAERDAQRGKQARRVASAVRRVTESIVAGASLKIGVPGAVELSFDANKALLKAEKLSKADREAVASTSFYHASFRALSNAFGEFLGKGGSRRIIVFIDDLDRCLPRGALQVLESMKLFFDIYGFVFVVGLDERIVELCVDEKFRRGHGDISDDSPGAEGSEGGVSVSWFTGSDYIQKLFQVPYYLPPVKITHLDEFLDSLCKEAKLPKSQAQEIRDVVRKHLDFLVTGKGINPRQIKRYINRFAIRAKMKPDLDRNTILTLQTISMRDDPEWDKVRAFLEPQDDPHAREELATPLEALPETFLNYVKKGAPGESLLELGSLDEYIYAGSSVAVTERWEVMGAQTLKFLTRLDLQRESIQALSGDAPESERQRVRLDLLSLLVSGQIILASPGGITPSGLFGSPAAATDMTNCQSELREAQKLSEEWEFEDMLLALRRASDFAVPLRSFVEGMRTHL